MPLLFEVVGIMAVVGAAIVARSWPMGLMALGVLLLIFGGHM